MIKYLNILLLTLVINCMTVQPQVSKPEIKISLSNGCQSYKGKEWDSCIIKLLKEFQDIYNSPVISEVLSENRVSEDNVVIVTKYCIKSICFEEKREEYRPTIFSMVKKNLIVFGGGILTGSIILLKSGSILIF